MPNPDNPKIIIETTFGEIRLELYPKRAPLSCQNILRYVAASAYDMSSFYRVVRADNMAANPSPNNVMIDVIQGGLGMADHPKKYPAIKLERTRDSGLKHLDGTISMSRFAPDSANSEFFICINDQPELDYGGARNPDGQGFAAFGSVFEGMDVVRKIHQAPAQGQALEPAVSIKSIRLVS